MLEKIKTGKISRAQRAILYAPEGLGKSTLASQFPTPLILDTEHGTAHLDVARIEINDWVALQAALEELTTTKHEYKTVAIDTIDWAEHLAIANMLARDDKSSIEAYGYGKGYVHLGETISGLLNRLNGLIAGGVHVLLLAHTEIKKFELPDQVGSFDRYKLKVTKHVEQFVKEWCDLLLFGDWETKVIAGQDGKARAIGGKERILYTQRAATHDAKNRHALPEKLPFCWEAIAPAFGIAVEKKHDEKGSSLHQRLAEGFESMEVKLENVTQFLLDRNQIENGQSWEDASSGYLERIAKNPGRFVAALKKEFAA